MSFNQSTPITAADIEKLADEALKNLSDKTFYTDPSKSPITERSISTTLNLEHSEVEAVMKMAEITNNKIVDLKTKSKEVLIDIETIQPPVLNTNSGDIPSLKVVKVEDTKINSDTIVKDPKNDLNISNSTSDFALIKLSTVDSEVGHSYIDKPLVPDTDIIVSNSNKPVSTARVINHNDNLASSDSENSTIYITKSLRALRREPKKDVSSEITKVKLYMPKKFVMQLEQSWFFNIRKECDVTIELSSYNNDTKSLAVTITGLPRNVSNACGKIAEAKIRILHKNSEDINAHTCKIYMIESKRTCEMLATFQEQFLQFISQKYQCYITVGSDEDPVGDEDIIALSGNSISIKNVVFEVLRKIKSSIIKVAAKPKSTQTIRANKTKPRSTSNKELLTDKDKTDDNILKPIISLKVPEIPDGSFVSHLNDSLFSESLLYLNEPSVRKELLDYENINIIYYKIFQKNGNLEIYAGFDAVYKSIFARNTIKNYEIGYNVHFDMSSWNGAKEQKFALLASVPNAFKILDKINDRINMHKKKP